MHGGKAPQNLKKAKERMAEKQAEKEVSRLGLKRNIAPSEALLEEVQWTAGHVEYARRQVDEADKIVELVSLGIIPDSLTFKVRDDEDEFYIAARAAKSQRMFWYDFYMRERAHLVRAAESAIRGGVEERRVAVAESQGLLVAGVVKRILGQFLTELLNRGYPVAEIWKALSEDIVPREFRALAAGAETGEAIDV